MNPADRINQVITTWSQSDLLTQRISARAIRMIMLAVDRLGKLIADELEQMRKEAFNEGYRQGYYDASGHPPDEVNHAERH